MVLFDDLACVSDQCTAETCVDFASHVSSTRTLHRVNLWCSIVILITVCFHSLGLSENISSHDRSLLRQIAGLKYCFIWMFIIAGRHLLQG
jgi:hypothetical protein